MNLNYHYCSQELPPAWTPGHFPTHNRKGKNVYYFGPTRIDLPVGGTHGTLLISDYLAIFWGAEG